MANSLKSVREKRGLTQAEVANLVGLNEGIIQAVEEGKEIRINDDSILKTIVKAAETPKAPLNKKSDEIWKGLPGGESEEKDKAFERDVLFTQLHGIETTLEIITDSLRNELAAMRDHFIGDMAGSCFNHIESLDYLHGEMSNAIAAFEKLIH